MGGKDSVEVTVKVAFGHAVREGATVQSAKVSLASDGSDSVHDLKSKTAAALGGSVTAEDLLLSFGPNERKLGRQYVGDPTVDEKALLLSAYTILAWLQRFPHWYLTARLLPPPPPPPGRGVVGRRASQIEDPVPPLLVPMHLLHATPTLDVVQVWPSRRQLRRRSRKIPTPLWPMLGPKGTSQRSATCRCPGVPSPLSPPLLQSSLLQVTSLPGTQSPVPRLSIAELQQLSWNLASHSFCMGNGPLVIGMSQCSKVCQPRDEGWQAPAGV